MPVERVMPWRAVGIGTVIRSASGRDWLVTRRSVDGRTLTLSAGADVRTVAPDPAAPVTVLESTELEALAAVFAAFPTSTIAEAVE